jgi:predicted membrane channel-forming protein YqfA (hemolysin III family)
MHSAMALLITGTYFKRGYMIYRANVPKWGVILHIIFLNSMLLNMWIRLLFEGDFEVMIIPVFLTMVVIGIFLHLRLVKKIAENIPNCDDIEVESNHMLELLQ